MGLNRVLSLKRINCVDSSTLFGSFNSSYAIKTQDLPEQIEGDLEASLCFSRRYKQQSASVCIGVRAGGARGAAAPQILGNSDFLGS